MSNFSRRTFLAAGATPLLAAPPQSEAAMPEQHLLGRVVTPDSLARTLIPRSRWKPYPTRADRAAWQSVVPEIREALVAGGARQLGKPYPPLAATLFLEYARNGNRSHFEAVSSARRTHLRQAVLAECVEAKGRFLDDIADGIWTICEETFWGYPAHLSAQKRGTGLPDVTEPIIDLFAAETAALLAWTSYLIGPALDRVQPLVRERIAIEMERRILAPYRDRNDFWWMGLTGTRAVNNWNPWINSNCLTAFLLFETDENRRARSVHKVITSLDRFLDGYHEDGGCDEGPSYWGRAGGSLFDNLDLLHSASGGRLDYYSLPLVQQIGKYIYRAHIAGEWFVNFADASAKIHLESDLVYRYGAAIKDPGMQGLAAYAAEGGYRAAGSLGRDLPAIFNYPELRSAEPRPPLVRDVWLPGTQVAAARMKGGMTEGFYFAALGGHNAESHNHNDVGNFVVFVDGKPVLIDVGVETYTAKTFSPQRYEIWTMQSSYHNLPAINGVMQHEGRQYEARDCTFRSSGPAAEFAADIAAAYPKEAGVSSYRRVIRLDRNRGELSVSDVYELVKGRGGIDMHLMTPCDVTIDGTRITFAGGPFDPRAVRVDVAGPNAPETRVEDIAVTDGRLRPIWGDRLRRVVIRWSELPRAGKFEFRCSAV